MPDSLTAFALNCSLKTTAAEEQSSIDTLIADVFTLLASYGVTGEVKRAADHDIRPGLESDEGEGDDWPGLRRRILAADIFILGKPI